MKSRINISMDDDILLWFRLEYPEGERSLIISDYLKFLRNNGINNKKKQKKEEITKQIEELKQQHFETMKQMTMLNSELQKIEKEDIIKNDKTIKTLEAQAEALKTSGTWADMVGK